MPDKTWKSIERKLARMFGTERNQDTHGFDFRTNKIIAEVKHRKAMPVWIENAMVQVEQFRRVCIKIVGEPSGKPFLSQGTRTPILFLHKKGQAIEDTLAVMRASDLKRLLDGDESQQLCI